MVLGMLIKWIWFTFQVKMNYDVGGQWVNQNTHRFLETQITLGPHARPKKAVKKFIGNIFPSKFIKNFDSEIRQNLKYVKHLLW